MYYSLDTIRQKDIKDLKLERYRLHIDVNVLVDFMLKIYSVNDKTLGHFLLK